MGDIIQKHPDITPGYIEQFGFYKIERQTKTVIHSILQNFFSKYSNLFKLTAPELELIDNNVDDTRLFIEKEFPFYQRKLPLIAILSKSKQEKKAFMGADDLLFSHTIKNTDTDELIAVNNHYGNIWKVPISLTVASTSIEQRMQLQELVSLCFTHYYRWVYHFKDTEGNCFNIVPNTGQVIITGESQSADSSNISVVYHCTLGMDAQIEYTFIDLGDNIDTLEVTGFELDAIIETDELGEEYSLGLGPIEFSSEWE